MPQLQQPWPLRPDRTALVIVDMQKVFCEPQGSLYVPSTEAIVPRIQELAAACRGVDVPVIFLRHIVRGDGSDTGRMRDLYPDVDQVLARYRRHSKDYEKTTASAEAFTYIAMINLMSKRLAKL